MMSRDLDVHPLDRYYIQLCLLVWWQARTYATHTHTRTDFPT